MQLHHVGIATHQAGIEADRLGSLLDIPVCHRETVDSVAVTFLELPDGYLELLEPVDSGPVERFLDGHGPGLHHIAFQTSDIQHALERANEAGIDLVDEVPRPGAWGHDVAFLHPRSLGGVLVEFVEP